jgi:hypothetical protein
MPLGRFCHRTSQRARAGARAPHDTGISRRWAAAGHRPRPPAGGGVQPGRTDRSRKGEPRRAGGGDPRCARRNRRVVVRVQRQHHRAPERRAETGHIRQGHRRDARSDAARLRGILRRLRQSRAVAAVPLPAVADRVFAPRPRGLRPGQPGIRTGTAADAAAGRPGLGARLPPDPVRTRVAAARLERADRIFPAHAVPGGRNAPPGAQPPRSGRGAVRL